MRRVVLSKRLQMIADMVTAGSRVADVGCDHGYLSIWLVQAGISPRVLAMDVRKGPLAAAEKHVEEYGLGDYIETRLSDGLKNCEAGEADTLVCAGMGGRLMERILTESMEMAKGMRELILQPQSELQAFRAFLRGEGFEIQKEEAVCEDGKFYFAMKAVPGAAKDSGADAGGAEAGGAEDSGADAGGADVGETEAGGAEDRDKDAEGSKNLWLDEYAASTEQRVYDRFGEKLILGKNPVLLKYLQWRRKLLSQLVMTMSFGDVLQAERAFGFGDPLGVGSVFGAEEDRRTWGPFGIGEDLGAGYSYEAEKQETEDALGVEYIMGASRDVVEASVFGKDKTGSERKRMRLDEILTELADVDHALKKMQQRSE